MNYIAVLGLSLVEGEYNLSHKKKTWQGAEVTQSKGILTKDAASDFLKR
jgi:hypothetical protein